MHGFRPYNVFGRCKLTNSHFAEPFWAFDCALIFWVIIKYGQESVHSSELKSALFAANCMSFCRGKRVERHLQ